MIVNFIDFRHRVTLIKNQQFLLKFNAGTSDNVYLSKQDIDVLITAFKNSKVIH